MVRTVKRAAARDVWEELRARGPVIALLSLAYFLTAWVGLGAAVPPGNATAIWLPLGLGLAVMLVKGRGVWPGVFLGSLAVNVFLVPTVPELSRAVWTSLAIAGGSTSATVLCATALERHGGRSALETPGGVVRFALAALVTSVIPATIGWAVTALVGAVAPGQGLLFWATWLLGDAVGMLVVVPFVAPRAPGSASRRLEKAGVMLAMIVAAQLVFGRPFPAPTGTHVSLVWLLVIPALWAGARFAPPVVAGQALLAYALISWATLEGRGPLSGVGTNTALLLVDAFLAMLVLCGLLLSASRLQREQAAEELLAERRLLQARVTERTASLEAAHAALTAELTERARLDRHVDQLQKQEAIGRLAGGVAHDFNNLLTVVTAEAELLATGDLTREQQDSLRAILDAAGRAGELTRQLLAVARREPGRAQAIDLAEHLTQVRRLVRPLLPENISLDVVPLAATVNIDPSQLERVLLNLTLNARDAMPRGGRLRIAAAAHELGPGDAANLGLSAGPWVAIEVQDDGEGMSPEVQARAFEPFFTTKKDKGHGLGLSSALGVAGQAGGTLRVRSAPGEGSTFTLWLPRGAGEVAPGATPTLRPDTASSKRTLLVVEDEPLVRRVVTALLTRAGYEVLSASDGEEAFPLATREQATIDLLITDVVMPRMGGVELAARLREEAPWRVLFMSGYHERQAELADERVLSKPFTNDGFLAAVHEALASQPKGRAQAPRLALTGPGR